MIAFGPVPSRRLGRSLGINNLPPKRCTYQCVYCQLGRTTGMGIERCAFHEPARIVSAVRAQVERTAGRVDHLTLVANGEPTLDARLGDLLVALRPLGIPLAVISNASLLWRPDVRADLGQADWVSLKVDTVREDTWHRINRPCRRLSLSVVLAGLLEFARAYRGELTTETMLVAGMNDGEEELREIARFLEQAQPATAYLAIPTRPPAERSVQAPSEAAVTRGFHLLRARLPRVDCLTGWEGNAFAATGNLRRDLLSIAAVHPLRREAVRALCERDHAGWHQVETLLRLRDLAEVEYAGETYYTRRWRKASR